MSPAEPEHFAHSKTYQPFLFLFLFVSLTQITFANKHLQFLYICLGQLLLERIQKNCCVVHVLRQIQNSHTAVLLSHTNRCSFSQFDVEILDSSQDHLSNGNSSVVTNFVYIQNLTIFSVQFLYFWSSYLHGNKTASPR